MTALSSLARFVGRSSRAEEACDLCASPIGPSHRHVVDVEKRRMQCACETCVRVFDAQSGRHRTVPTRVLEDASGAIAEAEWRKLGVPVGLAFFVRPSAVGRFVGIFPSPAGATEADLPENEWAAIEARCAVAREVRDDVEALVVRSRLGGEVRVFLAPIDVCYEVVGELRAHWTGFDGGDEVRAVVDAFVEKLGRRARGA